jgi:hypothetical protein
MTAGSSGLQVRSVETPAEQAQWDALAAGSPVGHRHQCLWWMEPLALYGFENRVLGCWLGDELIGGALFRSYRVPYTGTVVSECLDGPIFLRWESEWAEKLVEAIEDLARALNSMAVSIRDCRHEAVHRDILAVMGRRGWPVAVTRGAADAILTLQGRTLEQIRTGFNRGTRARIRKSQTGGLAIRHLSSTEELKQAYGAWIASAKRKGFSDVRPWPGLEPVLRHCLDHGIGTVLGSYAEGELRGAAFIVHIGSAAAYVYGGYVDGAERFSPTHLLQYEAIRESHEKGLGSYNFGNLLAEYEPAASGVDEFKRGFGAAPARHLDTIVWKRKQMLYDAIDHVRRARVGRRLEAIFRNRLIRRGDHRETHVEFPA